MLRFDMGKDYDLTMPRVEPVGRREPFQLAYWYGLMRFTEYSKVVRSAMKTTMKWQFFQWSIHADVDVSKGINRRELSEKWAQVTVLGRNRDAQMSKFVIEAYLF